MSDKELDASPAKSAKSRSRSSTRSPSRAKSAGSANDQSDSPRRSRSRSKSKSRSRSKKHKRRSRSHSRRRHSRSRSRSRRRRYSRSRSHSYDRRRSSRNDDDYDNGGSRGYVRRRSRSPFSRRRRHFGDRENPQTSRCLGVFGLSLYTQERDLREVFEHYGPVDEVQVVYDHQSGRSRGFAFVYMRTHEDAMEAKEMAAGAEIDGRKIRVDFSITARAHTPTPGVYLGRPGAGHKSRSPVHKGRDRRNSRSYSRSYSRSPRRY